MEKDKNKEEEIPGMGKKLPFEVPEGYFEELPNRIMARLPEESTRRIAWWSQARFWRIAAPALVLVMIAIGYQALAPQTAASADALLAEASSEELVAFLEQELDASDILHYDLAYTTEDAGLEDNLWEGSVEDPSVEDYLDDISLDDLEELGLDEMGIDL